MNKMNTYQGETGSIMIVALMLLVILTLIGIAATQTAGTDIMISGNDATMITEFYITEGANNREVQEIGNGHYAVVDIEAENLKVANQGSSGLPEPAHRVMGKEYDFEITYVGHFLPPKGYSSTEYSSYDYEVSTTHERQNIEQRVYRIGPKAAGQ
jgi:hypothetical protein